MPNLYRTDGSLDSVRTTIEGTTFSEALAAADKLKDKVTMTSVVCTINNGYPDKPIINAPSVSPAEQSITFSWTGANSTDGYLFVGVV